MGCDSSKEQVQSNPPDPQEEGCTGFTETQIDTIRSTWPLLSKDMIRVGTEVFVRIFTEVPTVKELFTSFQIKDANDLHKMPEFRRHAKIFMQVLQLVVDNLETPYPELNQEIMILGARHATFRGFKVEYFKFYIKCLIQVWELELGEEFILEVRDCWKSVFDFLVDNMSEGYELALKESAATDNVKTLNVSDCEPNSNIKPINGDTKSSCKSKLVCKQQQQNSLSEVQITS